MVGTGLIGTSIALALTRHGVRVHLSDADEIAAKTAESLGAGTLERPAEPTDLAVLAVPPSSVAVELARSQRAGLARAYTDVASVKRGLGDRLAVQGGDTACYVGGHPLAGRERSGPLAACADLFEGRYWVLTPFGGTAPDVVDRGRELAALCGATPLVMDADDHDRAVALTSHAPHLVASLMAGLLAGASGEMLGISGQGLRDVTRIGGGDAELWGQILGANAPAVADVLDLYATALTEATAALRAMAHPGGTRAEAGAAELETLLRRGVEGHRRIPRKPGPGENDFTSLGVTVPDQAGALARLLAAAAQAGVNIEDIRIEHAPSGRAGGMVGLLVARSSAVMLAEHLRTGGWHVQS